MSNAEMIGEKPISMSELKDELEKIKKRDKELNYRAEKTLEHLNQFTSKKTNELAEKLAKLDIPRFKEQHISKIADLLPTTVKDLKIILQGYTVTVNNENLKKIVDEVNEFLKK